MVLHVTEDQIRFTRSKDGKKMLKIVWDSLKNPIQLFQKNKLLYEEKWKHNKQ